MSNRMGWAARLLGLGVAALLLLATLGPRAARAANGGATQYAAGVAAAKAGHYAAAVHDFEQALLDGHNDAESFYQLGLAYSHNRQYNYAMWAIAEALTDDNFVTAHPKAQNDLLAAQSKGGTNNGPPPALRNVSVKTAPVKPLSPAQIAVSESESAAGSFVDPTNAYFISPEWGSSITTRDTFPLTSAAADLANNSSTTAKFIFLGATPAPFTDLALYAKDFFGHLGLQRGVLVVVTPAGAAAYSDRLDANDAARISAAQWHTVGLKDPVALAAGIARGVVKQADDNDNAANTRSLLIGVALAVVLLAAVALAIWRVAGTGRRRAPIRAAGPRGHSAPRRQVR